MPENTVYVGRPTTYSNPYPVNAHRTASEAVGLFKTFILRLWCGCHWMPAVRRELRGKNLACWCPLDQPCHADILLEIANGDSLE